MSPKLPTASVRSKAEAAPAGALLKGVSKTEKKSNLNFSEHFIKKYDFAYDFHRKIQEISKNPLILRKMSKI